MSRHRIMVVDDDPTTLDFCRAALSALPGAEVETEERSPLALKKLRAGSYDLLFSDLRMPELDGEALIAAVRETDLELPIVVLTGSPDVETAVACMKMGASDYLIKPVRFEQLKRLAGRLLDERALRDENLLLRRQLEQPFRGEAPIIGESMAMKETLGVVERVARTDVDILINGETGTGKELIARRLHGHSKRASQRFIPVNCGAIPESLAESELFGHERGAFTGAAQRKLGLIEYASGGTLFLDEVGELPASIQAKLLRVLQEKKLRRVGDRREISVDLRIVAATNRDLQEEVAAGRFREDLYYRLNVIPIKLAPLRKRVEDIGPIARHFLKATAAQMGLAQARPSDEFIEALESYRWPGNVRELQNIIKRVTALASGGELRAEHLPDRVLTDLRKGVGDAEGFMKLRDQRIRSFDIAYFRALLERCGGDAKEASRESGLPTATLYRWLKRCELRPKDFLKR